MNPNQIVADLIEILHHHQYWPTAAERAAMITRLLISDCQLTRDLRDELQAAIAKYERAREESRSGFRGGSFVFQ